MRFLAAITIFLLGCSTAVFALSCKQSAIIPLADTHQQTEELSKQFIRIDHIEVLPQNITPESKGFMVNSVQVLMCGELLPQTPIAATAGQTCQFDSQCQAPMRCQNQACALPIQ